MKQITNKSVIYVESVKEIISVLFVLHEELQVLEDAFLDLNSVVVAN